MKSNPWKINIRRNPVSRSILWAIFLLFLPTINARASFWDLQDVPWYGGTDHYCGDSLISKGTFRNSGKRTPNYSALPANTGALPAWGGDHKGDYWYGLGLMAKGDTGIVIQNDSGAIIQSIVTGIGEGQAAGIMTVQDATITNSGTVDAQFLNNRGWAAGVSLKSPGLLTNGTNATISATANYAIGLSGSGGRIKIVNNGIINANGIAGQTGTVNRNRAYGVDLFSWSDKQDAPLYFENNGTVTATSSKTNSDTTDARGVNVWAEGSSATCINTGTIQATAEGPLGGANGIYCGADNGNVTFINKGTITKTDANGDFCVGVENDSQVGDMYIENSGTITTDSPFAIMLGNYTSNLKACGHCTFKNTGTIRGQWLGLSWPAIGGMTFFDSGDIRTQQCWLGGNVDARIEGLPTIDPELTPADGNNTLVFALNGTLEQINGQATSGTQFSSLPSQGSIVVSGKTYKWKNFTSVSGTAVPGTTSIASDKHNNQPYSILCKNNVVSFSLPFKAESVVLSVYDAKGTLVSRIAKSELSAGRNSIPLMPFEASSARYIYELSIGQEKFAAAMVNVR